MQAAAEAAVLLAVMLLLSFWCNFPLESYLCLAIYFAVNIGYSLGLKNVPILDIALLVSGFLLRVLFGAAVTGIAISDWLYLTVIAMSFYLGLGKRRGELARQKGDTRKVLKYYTYDYLDKYMHQPGPFDHLLCSLEHGRCKRHGVDCSAGNLFMHEIQFDRRGRFRRRSGGSDLPGQNTPGTGRGFCRTGAFDPLSVLILNPTLAEHRFAA